MIPGGCRVCAVVVTHNRPQELRRVVAALQSQTRMPDRIVVLDNGSRVPASVTLSDFRRIEVIRKEENTGGAGGFALGLAMALTGEPEWVWLMDDDAVPRPRALSALLSAAARLPAGTGALCSTVYEFGGIATMHRRTFRGVLGSERPLPTAAYAGGPREIDTGSFVGFLVKAEAARQVGLPDGRFFLAYDDTEYSLRLKRRGWRLWLVPDSGIDHLRTPEGRLRQSEFGFRHYYNIRNRIFVCRRYCDPALPASLKSILIGTALWASSRKAWRISAVRLLWRAVVDGMRGRLGQIAA